MADNFQSSKVASNEQSSSTKFNNFVQAVEDAINSLDNSNVATAAAILVSKLAAGSNGDTLQTIAGVPTWSASVAAPGYATTLPGSPTNGQEAILVDSTTAPTYHWRFRYNSSSSSSYKWEFIGGTPVHVRISTAESTASSSYGDLATVGPSFTLPNAGDWDIAASFTQSTRTTDGHSLMSYAVGGTVASEDWCAGTFAWNGSAAGFQREYRHTGLSASTLIRAKYRTINGTPTFDERSIWVRPVRVS
jgi:hypothetical protein